MKLNKKILRFIIFTNMLYSLITLIFYYKLALLLFLLILIITLILFISFQLNTKELYKAS